MLYLTLIAAMLQATTIERTMEWDYDAADRYEIVMSWLSPYDQQIHFCYMNSDERRITALWPRGMRVTVIVTGVHGGMKLTSEPFVYDVPKKGPFHASQRD